MDAFLTSVKSTIDKVRTDDNISALVNLARLHLERPKLLHKNTGTWCSFYQVMDCYANDIDASMDRYTARDLADAMWAFATVGYIFIVIFFVSQISFRISILICKNKQCLGTIIKINISNRSTYMCNSCQK